MNDSATISRLQEVIGALDRRRPQAHRVGEAAIAQDAAAMKGKALERLAQLETPRPAESR